MPLTAVPPFTGVKPESVLPGAGVAPPLAAGVGPAPDGRLVVHAAATPVATTMAPTPMNFRNSSRRVTPASRPIGIAIPVLHFLVASIHVARRQRYRVLDH